MTQYASLPLLPPQKKHTQTQLVDMLLLLCFLSICHKVFLHLTANWNPSKLPWVIGTKPTWYFIGNRSLAKNGDFAKNGLGAI